MIKIKFVLCLLIPMLCACGNKSKNSTGSRHNSSFTENRNSSSSKYKLEKHVEDDGFVWYLFTEKGKKKGISVSKGAMNKNKEIIIGPFWGGYIEYSPKDKRFHLEVLFYDHDPKKDARPDSWGEALYDVDGNCIIPASRHYSYIMYEKNGLDPFYYTTGHSNEGLINGVCDQFGKVLIEPGSYDKVKYEYVEKYEKEMFVLYDDSRIIYTQIYLNKNGEGVKYTSSGDDYTTSSSSGDNYYSNDNYSNDNYQNETRQPSRNPCRACRKNPGVCAGCDGARQIKQHYNSSTGTWMMTPCYACGGTGICKGCNGDGWLDEGVDF